MSRYFFHVVGTQPYTDEEGTELPDEASVRSRAIEAARDMLAEGVREGLDRSHWQIFVEDEQGQTILSLPFSDALRRD